MNKVSKSYEEPLMYTYKFLTDIIITSSVEATDPEMRSWSELNSDALVVTIDTEATEILKYSY